MDNEVKGLIFDIQGYSVHDGPGVRTLIFFKGCPLRCEWCSNPEGMHLAQEIMFSNVKCTNRSNQCFRCIEACPAHAIQVNPNYLTKDDAQVLIDRQYCVNCGDHPCLDVCYFEGLRLCGTWKTVEEIMHTLQRNRHYWGNNGGVSFSGGEPLFQPTFLRAILEACQEERIHTSIETTAYAKTDIFLGLMKMVDFAFIDVKHMNPELHEEKTGVRNELILSNIEQLTRSGFAGRLVLRMPVIEGYNDNEENIVSLAEFMHKNSLVEINILPFHRLGSSKWNQLGKEYSYEERQTTEDEQLFRIQDIFLSERIACYVGSDTPF